MSGSIIREKPMSFGSIRHNNLTSKLSNTRVYFRLMQFSN